MSDELNFVQKARREKLDALVAAGVAPFAYGYERTHDTANAIASLPAEAEVGPVVRGHAVRQHRQDVRVIAELGDPLLVVVEPGPDLRGGFTGEHLHHH